MITSFPVKIKTCKLFAEDFSYFSTEYKQIILDCVVTAQEVRFVDLAHHNNLSKDLHDIIKNLVLEEKRAAVSDDRIIFLYACENGEMIAIVSGLDPLVIEKASSDWLEETYDSIRQSCLQLKEERINLETGLLNQHHLNTRLLTGDISSLFLVEIPPARNGSRYIFSHLQAVCNSFTTYIQANTPVYYLGNSLFAVSFSTPNNPLQFAEALLAYLKREGFKKVHIGVGDYLKENSQVSGTLLDQGWTALQEAVRRGPYSFCSYSSLLDLDNHPLAPPPTTLKKNFSRFVQKHDSFSVILFSDDEGNPLPLKKLEAICGSARLYSWNKDVAVVLPKVNAGDGLHFAENIIKEMGSDGTSLSAGLSYYPNLTFKKADTLLQARKALLHTSFYGSGTATSFDAVSCNVSGDIYYAEGNFTNAAKEYRTGLAIDLEEINLLNSLGVTYAMMGRKTSLDCFEKVLDLDPENFMALYNIGLFYLTAENNEKAADCFEKALQVGDQELEDSEAIKQDLQLQLGILCSKLKRSERAIDLLSPLTADREFSCKHNILFYLGKSYADADKRKEAIRWLQKAAAAKCFEDQTLSLLGYLYLLEGQGHDIALSLCRKSVALNPVDHLLSLRLAEVLIVCEQYEEAKLLVQKSMRKKNYRQEAARLAKKISKKIKKL